VLRIKGRPDGIALTVDGGHRIGSLDPRRGAQMAVAEALRNLAVVGAEPLALTNCLNFGDPDQPEVMWQLEEAVAGLAEAAAAFEVPVVSGNVSLYNDFQGSGIPPTPVVGMVGQVQIDMPRAGLGFKRAGDVICLVGPLDWNLAGSEYQRLAHGEVEGSLPKISLEAELAAARVVRQLVLEGMARSAHDCALGGLALTLAESCIAGGLGAVVELTALPPRPEPPSWRWGLLFGEAEGRYVLSLASEGRGKLIELCRSAGVAWRELGLVGGSEILISGMATLSLQQAASAYRGTLSHLMERR
jgi:phosphoribosylformylglycinamidine synthase